MFKLALMLFMSGGFLFSASGSISKTDDKAIHQLYLKLSSGMKAKDIRAIIKTEAPNFEEIEGGHVITAEIVNQQMQAQFVGTKKISRFDIAVTSLTVSGKKGRATTSFVMEATIGPFKRGDHDHKMVVHGTTEETFLKTKDRGWLFASTKDLSSNTFLDGKPFNSKKS